MKCLGRDRGISHKKGVAAHIRYCKDSAANLIVRSDKVLDKKAKEIKRGRKENFIFIFMIDILFKIYLHDGRQLMLNQWLETMIA